MTLDKNIKRPYSIEPYNPAWPLEFEKIKKELAEVFGAKVLAIEHVGSTSVPGMKAKPIVDVLAIVEKMEGFVAEKLAMEGRGYKWTDDYIAPDTVLFYKETEGGRKTVNIHICVQGSPKARQFVLMRDYYRAHPEEAQAYADLKVKLNAKYSDDYPAYRAGKKEFLDALELRAEEWAK